MNLLDKKVGVVQLLPPEEARKQFVKGNRSQEILNVSPLSPQSSLQSPPNWPENLCFHSCTLVVKLSCASSGFETLTGILPNPVEKKMSLFGSNKKPFL